MDPVVAADVAARAHRGQTDHFGELVIEHLARVASAVPPEARSVAWLHEILERTDTDVGSLLGEGLGSVEVGALDLLTRRASQPYETYALRLAWAYGEAGRLARMVKRADLDDNIARSASTRATRPYAWARRHIVNAQARNDELTQPVAV